MKRFLYMLLALFIPVAMHAQIGYQVALMDQSTGKPRANETVNVTVTISDNAGKTICTETTTQTTNSFGMLALQVGDANTFNNVDWSKLPLWVSANVGGVTIGKSQILNVPVAEHAKHVGTLTRELLVSKTWRCNFSSLDYQTANFHTDGTFTVIDVSYEQGPDGLREHRGTMSGPYYILNDMVIAVITSSSGMDIGKNECYVFVYCKDANGLASTYGSLYR